MLHQVGAGSLGPVFRAHDPAEGRLVAVKAFTLDLPPDRARAFVAALEALASHDLDHPAIAIPVAAGLEGSVPWFAQAYVPAEPLDRAIAQFGPPPLADVLAIVTHLAGALDFAAAAGVLHGALHPRDVLVAPDETYVIDLGIAGALQACGLPPPLHHPYSAPELAHGALLSRAADVFSLAAIAFELIAGAPIGGLGDEAAMRLPAIPGADGERLVETFAFALAGPADERYPTALGFAAALKRALGDAPSQRVAALPVVPAAPDDDGSIVASEPDGGLPPAAAGGVRGEEFGAQEFLAPEPPGTAVEDEEDDRLRSRDPSAPRTDAVAPISWDELGPADSDFRVGLAESEGPDLGVEEPGAFADVQDEPVPPAYERQAAFDAAAPPDIELRHDEVPGRAWDEEHERAARGRRTAAPPRPAEPRRDRPWRRWAAIAAVLGIGMLAGVAGGYFWGRTAVDRPPALSGDEGTGTGVAIGGTDEGAADAGDGATEIELPPEVIPEPLEGAPESAEAESAADLAAEEEEAPAPADTPASPRASPDAGRSRPQAPQRSSASATAPGRLVIRSTPPGASVEVNGRGRGDTPLTLEGLALGAYDVRVTRQGYAPEQRRVTLTRGRSSQTLSVPMRRVAGTAGTRAAPDAAHASVFVDSRPRGATVYIDGRAVGTTPLQLPEVSVGRHVFRLERAGYRAWTDTVQVVGGERTRVAASLEEETR